MSCKMITTGKVLLMILNKAKKLKYKSIAIPSELLMPFLYQT